MASPTPSYEDGIDEPLLSPGFTCRAARPIDELLVRPQVSDLPPLPCFPTSLSFGFIIYDVEMITSVSVIRPPTPPKRHSRTPVGRRPVTRRCAGGTARLGTATATARPPCATRTGTPRNPRHPRRSGGCWRWHFRTTSGCAWAWRR